MKARCPNCWTVFRLKHEHLSARGGKVRCGQCQEIFNALGNLIDEDGENYPVLLDPKELEGLESLQEFPLPEDRRLDALTPTGDDPSENVLPGGVPPEPPLRSPDELLPSGDFDSPLEENSEKPQESEEESLLAPFDALAPSDEDEGEAEILKNWETEEIVGAALRETSLPRQEAEARAPEMENPDEILETLLAEDSNAEAPRTPPVSERGEADASGQAEKATETRAAPPREISGILADIEWAESFLAGPFGHSAGADRRFMIGALFLGVLFLFQAVGRFRGEIAFFAPVLRPPLEFLSRAFGASVPLPRHIELIHLEASDLQNDPERGLLILSALLRNRARYGQAYPSLELFLTDARDKALVRRVFDPSEYLPLKLSPRQAFAANSEINIRLWVETRDVKPVGYRLYVAYP